MAKRLVYTEKSGSPILPAPTFISFVSHETPDGLREVVYQ